MTKTLDTLVTKLRKNPESFAKFVHELSHALTPEEVAHVAEHSQEVHNVETVVAESALPDGSTREQFVAKQLVDLAEQLLNGSYKLDPRAVGIDIKLEHVYEGK